LPKEELAVHSRQQGPASDRIDAHQESLLQPLEGNWRTTPHTTGRTRSKYGSNERKPIHVGDRIYTASEARTWLRLRGYEVPSTGRISDEHLAAFTAAMTGNALSRETHAD
jgi:hypothetical protein